jgi:hypothetical protein
MTTEADKSWIEMLDASSSLFKMFRAHVDAGFSEKQAMELLLGQLSMAAPPSPKETETTDVSA